MTGPGNMVIIRKASHEEPYLSYHIMHHTRIVSMGTRAWVPYLPSCWI